jgi:small basic protein
MGRYDGQKPRNKPSLRSKDRQIKQSTPIWKIIIGVALGVMLAGVITTAVSWYLAVKVVSGVVESINNDSVHKIQHVERNHKVSGF